MSLLDIIKSLQNADESVTGSRTIPSSLTSTNRLIDTSGNSMSKDTALPDTVWIKQSFLFLQKDSAVMGTYQEVISAPNSFYSKSQGFIKLGN